MIFSFCTVIAKCRDDVDVFSVAFQRDLESALTTSKGASSLLKVMT